MELTETIRLSPSLDDRERLIAYCRRVNTACNWLSEIAFDEKLFHWYKLQKRTYQELRNKFNLSSAQIVSIVRKVADAYKGQRERKVVFRLKGAIPLYRHSYKKDETVCFYGFRIPFRAKENVPLSGKAQAQLVIQGKKFLIRQIVKVGSPDVKPAKDYLGVDLGVKNIAVDSDGQFYTGREVNGLRIRHLRLRAKLQKKGTKSAKRLLKKRSGKESRFARNINHIVSKDVVNKANDTGRGMALEDLRNIRASIKVRRPQRYLLHSWGFGQLRSFIEYKAERLGVPVVFVNPKDTSRTCPSCGCVDRRNRKEQALFECVGCGYAGHADRIAAENIRRAAGNQPHVAPKLGSCECTQLSA
jgi:IS605 OrfB family transposase